MSPCRYISLYLYMALTAVLECLTILCNSVPGSWFDHCRYAELRNHSSKQSLHITY